MTRIFDALEQARREQVRGSANQAGLDAPGGGDSWPPVSRGGVGKFVAYSPAIERAMVGLYQRIYTEFGESSGKTVEFIGAHRGEGTSVLIRQFALVVATKMRKKVLLLDGDQERPVLLESFGLQSARGWQEVVEGKTTLDDPSVVCPVGDLPLAVAELKRDFSQPVFTLPGIQEFMTAAKEIFDLVLLRVPPAGVSSDGFGFSDKVDGVVILVEAEKTRWQVADNTRMRVLEQGGKVLGVVLNNRRHIIPKCVYKRI